MLFIAQGEFMLRHLAVIGVLLLIANTSAAADAQGIYKWTDAQGEVHYSQFPPPGVKTEKLNAPPPPAHSPGVLNTGGAQEQLDKFEQQNKEKLQGAKDAKQWVEIQKIRRSNCETAHKNLTSLQRGGNVRYMGPNGEILRLTDEERKKRIDEANKQIEENCSP
jgi:hypothetical protein